MALREPDPQQHTPPGAIAGIVLAAGRSSRMAPANKLLLDFDGRPLIRRVVNAALAARLSPVVLVTGHAADALASATQDLTVQHVHNPRHQDGMAGSIRHGVAALPAETAGAVFLLGDMPLITATHLRALCAAFDPTQRRSVCVPTWNGRRGNPVLWGAEHFPELLQLSGDRGARGLFEHHAQRLHEVPMLDDAVLIDIDTAENYAELQARLQQPATQAVFSTT